MILVTGGTGLVGSHLLFELLKGTEKIRAIYRSKESLEKAKNVFGFYTPDPEGFFNKIEWVKADMGNVLSLEPVFSGISKVYHCAAMVSFVRSDKELMIKNNKEGTANLVNLSLINNITSFCHVSSVASIGRQNGQGQVTELNEFEFSEKNSNYSYSKYLSELEVWRGIAEGLNAVIVNPAVILGPGDWNNGSGSIFDKIYKRMNFYSEGTTGFVDVKDVASVMIKLMDEEIFNERFILSENNYSYKTVFEKIAKAFNKKPPGIKATPFLASLAWRVESVKSKLTGKRPIITKESVRSSFSKTQYSNKKIKEKLDFEFTPIEESIINTAKLYKA